MSTKLFILRTAFSTTIKHNIQTFWLLQKFLVGQISTVESSEQVAKYFPLLLKSKSKTRPL